MFAERVRLSSFVVEKPVSRHSAHCLPRGVCRHPGSVTRAPCQVGVRRTLTAVQTAPTWDLNSTEAWPRKDQTSNRMLVDMEGPGPPGGGAGRAHSPLPMEQRPSVRAVHPCVTNHPHVPSTSCYLGASMGPDSGASEPGSLLQNLSLSRSQHLRKEPRSHLKAPHRRHASGLSRPSAAFSSSRLAGPRASVSCPGGPCPSGQACVRRPGEERSASKRGSEYFII